MNRLREETVILSRAMCPDVIFKHPFTCIIAGPNGSVSCHFVCAFYRSSALFVRNTGLREELNGVLVNGRLFPLKSWTC